MAVTDACGDDDLVPVSDAAKVLGVHADTLRRWEEKGRIRVYRTPTNHRRYRVGDLRSLLAEGTVEPAGAVAGDPEAVAS